MKPRDHRGGRHEDGSFYRFRDGSLTPVTGKGGKHARRGCGLVVLVLIALPALVSTALLYHWG